MIWDAPGQIGVSSSTRTTQDSGERPAEHCCEDRIMRNIMREVLEPIRTSKFNWYRKTKAPMRQILGMHSLSSTVRMMVYDLSYQKKMSDFKHPTFMAVATSRDCCRTWHEMFPNWGEPGFSTHACNRVQQQNALKTA
mmetsp:Transcript_46728/g.124089  ORF Transcript_46728/g.124089 Transcript_46728/m.124089 type:complete len:138 (+) Transcript_46728:1345-1758(+)